VHGLKSIGYVHLSLYTPSLPSPSKKHTMAQISAKGAPDAAGSTNRPYIAAALAVLVLVAAYTLPLFYK
jgi:hypothetical protein